MSTVYSQGSALNVPYLLGGLWRYRELLRNLVLKEWKVRYRGSWLGLYWSLLHPLFTIAVYWLAFEYILSFRVHRYPLFLLIGIFHWQTFNQALRASSRAILANGNLLNKAIFPREILPLAAVTSAFAQLGFTLLVLIPALILLQASFSPAMLLYLPALALYFLFSVGVGLALSALTVFFRDLEQLFDVALRFLFWLTPILYPFSIVPEPLAQVLQWNPMVPFFRTYQDLLYGGVLPEATRWLAMGGWSLVALLVGYGIFRRFEGRFAEEV